jgi:hypothetical protein
MKNNQIHSLRKSGWKIRVTHQRWYVDETQYTVKITKGHCTKIQPRFLFTKHEAETTVANGTKIPPISPKGGVTSVVVTDPQGNCANGVAHCSEQDAFSYKRGSMIALGMALAKLDGKTQARLEKKKTNQVIVA